VDIEFFCFTGASTFVLMTTCFTTISLRNLPLVAKTDTNFFQILRDPVLSASGRKSVGWPLYSPNSRYILRIDDSAPNEIKSRSGRIEEVFVPVIEADRNEESCMFWNKLIPFLQRSHEEKCRLEKVF
jgi:hypothetical protein